MNSATAAIVGASIGAFAVLVASVVVPWIRDARDRKRVREERRYERLSDLIRDSFRAVAASPFNSPDTVRAQANEEGRILMEINLIVGREGDAVSNTVMFAFSSARLNPELAPPICGFIARELTDWLNGKLEPEQVFARFRETIDVPQELLDKFESANDDS